VRTFLLVAFVMVLIIVGASVGGAVGGRSMHENQPVAVDNWARYVGHTLPAHTVAEVHQS